MGCKISALIHEERTLGRRRGNGQTVLRANMSHPATNVRKMSGKQFERFGGVILGLGVVVWGGLQGYQTVGNDITRGRR